MACEFSAGGSLLEIFRVFEGLAKDCISISCKHIENRPEKDGVLTVEKRRFFPKKIAEFAIILELNGYSDCLKIG